VIVTAEQILSWSPCPEYPESRVRQLVGAGVTPRQVAEADLPAEDRYWVLCHLLSPEDQRLLAAAVAERALMAAGVTDSRSWEAIRVARLFAMGEATEAELDAAWAAADAAAAEAAEAMAARANAVERTSLQNQYRTLDIELKEAKAAAAETPTQASAALEHARNVAAAFTLQIEPDKKSRFWANYGLSAWGGLATSLASIAAAILLAASTVGAWRRQQEYEQPVEARNPYLQDMRPAHDGGSLSQTFALQEGDGIEAMRIALRRLAERNQRGSPA